MDALRLRAELEGWVTYYVDDLVQIERDMWGESVSWSEDDWEWMYQQRRLKRPRPFWSKRSKRMAGK